ncbi:MAG TPA: PRC-barrel domain-containing protein [Acidimicrobiales bacterium]|jgi:hypothetical protein|nr:PRC-barrel domain-containing protein [Acidimicrobiales bacterium]
MTTPTVFTIGTTVTCSDGAAGHLRRVILDPVARAITHIVVEPPHGKMGHLVAVDLIESVDGNIQLRCSLAEFAEFEPAEETRFLLGSTVHPGYRPEQVLVWPFFGTTVGAGLALGGDGRDQTITYERVPMGEVSIRRGEHMRAKDGDLGKVKGLVVDPADHHVTHVLLEEGHLWKKHVAIPIAQVTHVTNVVEVDLTKEDLRELPDIGIDDPSHPKWSPASTD